MICRWWLIPLAIFAMSVPASAQAVPDMQNALTDPFWTVRVDAVACLGATGGTQAVPQLLVMLADEAAPVREAAAAALQRIYSRLPEATLAIVLQTLEKSPSLMLRARAAEALGHIKAPDAAAIQMLAAALASPDAGLRAAAAAALGAIGPPARATVSKLTQLLSDVNIQTRAAAATALGAIGKDAAGAASHLTKLLRLQPTGVKMSALRSLQQINADPYTVVPAICEALDDADADMRTKAAQALATIPGPALCRVPSLTKALLDPIASVRATAATALGDLGETAAGALPALQGLMQDISPVVAAAATAAISKIGPPPTPFSCQTECIYDACHTLAPIHLRSDNMQPNASLTVLNSLQERLVKLSGKISVNNYFYGKAQAWLSFAMDEYYESDRTGVIEAAAWEACIIVTQLENNVVEIPGDTKIIVTSQLLREDLWQVATQMKQSPCFDTVADIVAELEVTLVAAGHETKQLGPLHANTTLQRADRLAKLAQDQIAACRK